LKLPFDFLAVLLAFCLDFILRVYRGMRKGSPLRGQRMHREPRTHFINHFLPRTSVSACYDQRALYPVEIGLIAPGKAERTCGVHKALRPVFRQTSERKEFALVRVLERCEPLYESSSYILLIALVRCGDCQRRKNDVCRVI